MSAPDLKALSYAATDGPWYVENWDEEADEILHPYTVITECGAGAGYDIISASPVKNRGEYARDPEYIAALVNAHRAGQLFTAADVDAAVLAEREACADLCQKSSERRGQQASTAVGVQRSRWIAGWIEAETLAAAIRARNEIPN